MDSETRTTILYPCQSQEADDNSVDHLFRRYPFFNFPDPSGGYEHLLVHTFKRPSGEADYAVIGKCLFSPADVRSHADIKKWLQNLDTLIHFNPTSFNPMSFRAYHYILQEFESSLITKNVQFSQEGFDLIHGKQYVTDGIIQRTVAIDRYVSPSSPDVGGFANFYREINTRNRVFPDQLFCPFDQYQTDYFLTVDEKKEFDSDRAFRYAETQSDRLTKKIKFLEVDWILHFYENILRSPSNPEVYREGLITMLDIASTRRKNDDLNFPYSTR